VSAATAGHPPQPSAAAWLRGLARAAAGPVACAAILVGLLSAWVALGGGGTITPLRIEISLAAVPMRAYPGAVTTPSGPASTFLTISNTSTQPDELLSVRSPVAYRTVLRRRSGPQDPGTVVSELKIPARTSVTLSPFGNDVVLEDPRPFENDTTVPLTLTFRHAGQITVDASVSAPGTP
jgi:copper(I)-binding protein